MARCRSAPRLPVAGYRDAGTWFLSAWYDRKSVLGTYLSCWATSLSWASGRRCSSPLVLDQYELLVSLCCTSCWASFSRYAVEFAHQFLDRQWRCCHLVPHYCIELRWTHIDAAAKIQEQSLQLQIVALDREGRGEQSNGLTETENVHIQDSYVISVQPVSCHPRRSFIANTWQLSQPLSEGASGLRCRSSADSSQRFREVSGFLVCESVANLFAADHDWLGKPLQ